MVSTLDMEDSDVALLFLEKKEAEFKALADNAPVLVIRIDKTGIIEYINHVCDHDRNRVIGSSVFEYVLPESHEIYHKNIEEVIRTGKTKLFEIKANIALADEEPDLAYYEVSMAPIKINDEIQGLVVISTDITEKWKAKEALEKALREKDALLREVHHRAKNNLQVISSVLSLHSRKTDDTTTLGILSECKNSIHSLALVHECLYKSNDFSQISLNDYVERFCFHFKNSMLSQTDIALEIELDEARISMDRAITCGLILNELVVNAYKHGFPGKEGKIHVGLKNANGKLALTVSDNGVGIPREILEEKETFGFELIGVLMNQLDAELITKSSSIDGTTHTILFSADDLNA